MNITLKTATRTAAASFHGGFVAATHEQGGGNDGLIGDTFFPNNWNDLWKLEEPLDWEAFLSKSDLLRKERSNANTYAIIQRTSGSISIIASTLLIVHVLRSHQGLSTTYHRLMFGLSIADIVYSSALVLSSLMVPKELAYMIPGAQGNVRTCTAQGFFAGAGLAISTYYNCSICFYYLAIIKYNKSDAYIAKKLEPWFHGIPIISAMQVVFLTLAIEGFNTWGNTCFLVPHDPPHCIGYEDGKIIEGFSIPCGRGNGFYKSIMFRLLTVASQGPPPIIIVTTMVMMYRTVIKIERKAARYGVSALRLKNREERVERGENNLNEDATPPPSIIEKIQHFISCRLGSLWHFLICRNNNYSGCDANDHVGVVRSTGGMAGSSSKASKRAASRKRAILQMASGYVAAWALVWLPGFLVYYFQRFETWIFFSFFCSLQGFFNFIVFMSPKVRAAKKPSKRRTRGRRKEEQGELSWYKAISTSYMSRGERLNS